MPIDDGLEDVALPGGTATVRPDGLYDVTLAGAYGPHKAGDTLEGVDPGRAQWIADNIKAGGGPKLKTAPVKLRELAATDHDPKEGGAE